MIIEGAITSQGPAKAEPQPDLSALANQIKAHDKVRIYHVDGHAIFEGTPREVSDFWRAVVYANPDEIGSITDLNGQTIVRFGASNEHGFVARENVLGVLSALGDVIADSEIPESGVLSEADRDAELRHCGQISNEVYQKRRLTLQDDLMLVSVGMDPDKEMPFYDLVSGEVGRNFDAHGIAKTDQLQKLLALLEKGISKDKPFSSAPFEVRDEERAMMGQGMGTGGGTCYKDGIAIVTAGYRESLLEDGIKHVFINDVYKDLVDPLKKLFPQYQIHLLSEQKAVLEAEVPASDLRDAHG